VLIKTLKDNHNNNDSNRSKRDREQTHGFETALCEWGLG